MNAFSDPKVYVVQTSPKAIERCILMTSNPGDLVLDPTCGSGTTAMVAEQLGRRWITIDTSRVAVALARQRLLTGEFDYYKLADPAQGLTGDFCYKSIPYVTLKSIAQNAALDPIIEKYEPIFAVVLAKLNTELKAVTPDLRIKLRGKLATKQKAEGKRSIRDADRRRWLLPPENREGKPYTHADNDLAGWHEWEVPFDADPDWPAGLKVALEAYRKAWRAKMDEVNACIAAHAEPERLADQPEVEKGIVRVSGPFTVEGVMPLEASLDSEPSPIGGAPDALQAFDQDEIPPPPVLPEPQNAEAFADRMLRHLRVDGVRFPDNKDSRFERLERMSGGEFLHAEGEWQGGRRAAVSVGPQFGAVTAYQVENAMRMANRRGYDDLIFAGFSFDGAAQGAIQEEHESGQRLKCHLAHIRPELSSSMDGLLKETGTGQLFTVFGQPRARLIPLKDGGFKVKMEGVDIYDPVTHTLRPTDAGKVAAWFLDSNYDGRTFCVTQAFFPDRSAWEKIEKALKGKIEAGAFDAFAGTESLPFAAGKHKRAAVKVIDPRGNEVMKLLRLDGKYEKAGEE